MDVLTDICATLRLQSKLYFHAQLCSPFAVHLSEDKQLVRFHCVLKGACYLTIPNEDPVLLETGDLILVPNGIEQVLSSSVNVDQTVSIGEVLDMHPIKNGVLRIGAGETDTHLLCGYLCFDHTTVHPILSALPQIAVIRPNNPYCGSALRLLQDEAVLNDQGASIILNRVIEIILLQTLRNAVDMELSVHTFAAALRDPKLMKCLTTIHDNPQHQWTLKMLASQAGVSRSVLSERFNKIVGMGPISYLTQWRMTKAKELLSMNNQNMAEISEQCGYTSVAAFTRRFSSTYGIGPSLWRKTMRKP